MIILRLTIRNFAGIRELDLDLEQVNILIGPNGAGKSTILRAISELRRHAWPSAASTLWGARDGDTHAMVRMEFQMESQLAPDQRVFAWQVTSSHQVHRRMESARTQEEIPPGPDRNHILKAIRHIQDTTRETGTNTSGQDQQEACWITGEHPARIGEAAIRTAHLTRAMRYGGPIIADNPGALLHPDALRRLGAKLKEHSVRNQVILATHSPILVSALGGPEGIIEVARDAHGNVSAARSPQGEN